ncbi:hypothetical protein MMC11_003245 [Xylographa trunciseda]|nr:hypothetical protein [Xylographa trunciseda]
MSISSEYTLSGGDLFLGHSLDNGPVIRAAANADRRAYTANALVSGYFYGIWNTPLHRAISSQLPLNVQTLLEAGADPNGFDIESLSAYAYRFLRFRTWKSWHVLYNPESDWRRQPMFNLTAQFTPLSSDEILKRQTSTARFWTEEELIPLDKDTDGDTMHSLVAAAKTGNIDIFDQLYQAGADASFWKAPQTPATIPDPPTASSLAVTTPLHAAISAGHTDMIQHPLSLSFNPNALALSVQTQALTPFQSTLLSNPPNLPLYSLLASHPLTAPHTLTPLYRVHTLHLAVAHLSLPLLHHLTSALPLSSTPPTALGHTLLHIACLPLTDSHIQLFAPKSYASLHELRTLDPHFRRARLQPARSSASTSCPPQPAPQNSWADYRRAPSSGKHDVFPLPSSDYFPAQTAVVRYLLASGTQDVAAQDVHGNTALHYLAGHRVVNEALVAMLRERGPEEVWAAVRNRWGWTPKDVWLDGKESVEEPHKGFWRAEEEEVQVF